MIHNHFKQLSFTITMLISIIRYAQSDINKIELKRGEVFDVLVLSQNADKGAELQDFFKTAFPVATKMSYKPIPGYKITDLTAGNHQAEVITFGKWDNVKLRESFLETIVKDVPDFHDRRREIWSYFGLTYYEIKKDMTIEIDKKKHNVVASYWAKPNESLKKFTKQSLKLIKKHGGQVILSLKDGVSPLGYYYQPDLMMMTSWDSKEQFEAYQAVAQGTSLDNIQHINQFGIN